MSFLQSVRKVTVCWCSILIPAAVFAQNSFVSSGGEYAIAGKLPGDQVYPCVNFTTNGGYIVWQDNWIDGNGLGIGAMRVQNDLSSSGVAFRVNSLVAGDQEQGQVAMLNNGGAVFAWQGGQQGFEHIYSRFLSPSNNWATGDVQVNSATNYFQTSPAIATLLNGNVVMVYSSVGQAATGSMQDVYLQIFTPDGNKAGGEILVNQFTDNNQRSPAVAALANGGFVVAWVSEQERWTDASNGVPSVDIYARTFNSDGTPSVALPNESLVNVSSNVCANPALAAAPDGGFMASWMEKDLVVRDNGWDIYARRFSSSGVGGNVTRVNTQLYGDQYLPRIQRAGTNYLDIWTSMGQDGSREGVFGCYLNDDATTSGGEFQVNTTTFGSQMQQTLGSDGAGRFLAAWTSFGVGLDSYDLYAQKYINPALVSLGTNNTNFNSDPNANPNSVSSPPPPVPLPPPPPGPTNPVVVTYTFLQVQGTYNGLVYDPNGVTSVDSGYVNITTTGKGGFTAKLQLGGKNYSFSGKFSSTGTNTTQLGSLTISLLLDLHGGNQITGQISNGDWTASLQAYRAVFSKTNPTPLSGAYTMVVQSGNGVQGNGIGTLSVTRSGDVNWTMTLPDGTKSNQKTTLSQDGSWPMYAAPYKGGGVVIGWMQFSNSASDGFTGQCVWVKPVGAASPYSGGLTNTVTILGSNYKAPPLAYRSFGASQIIFNDGGLASAITNSVMWGLNNKLINQGPAKMSLSLTTATGLFKGTVVDPASGKSVPFQGVLYEKDNVGLGYFPAGDQSGTVSLAPNN